MREKFFKLPCLRDTIKNCIEKINQISDEDIDNLSVLCELKKQLTCYTQERSYKKLCSQDKQDVNTALNNIENKILTIQSLMLNPVSELSQEFSFQVPSPEDLIQMQEMRAGGDEDQSSRLTHMTQILARYCTFPIITTNTYPLPDYWQQLFHLIDTSSAEEIFSLLAHFPEDDAILSALLKIHSLNYLQKLITYTLEARVKGQAHWVNDDIIITPKTFELLIKDVATTLFTSAPFCFSLGLPSHHAHCEVASGFCFINKTAVLIKHWAAIHKSPLRYVVVGTDVNRDDGLCDVLMRTSSDMNICHIDVFDSRVYPNPDYAVIESEFRSAGIDVDLGIKHWRHNNLNYLTVDLSITLRIADELHPALVFTLAKVTEELELARVHGEKLALLLPTGWDSHQDETAYCGKYVHGRALPREIASQCRFNDRDLRHFYERLFELYYLYQEHIAGVYWGLEGGYDRGMYEQQIKLMLGVLNVHVLALEMDGIETLMEL